jgi:hypothetical protein
MTVSSAAKSIVAVAAIGAAGLAAGCGTAPAPTSVSASISAPATGQAAASPSPSAAGQAAATAGAAARATAGAAARATAAGRTPTGPAAPGSSLQPLHTAVTGTQSRAVQADLGALERDIAKPAAAGVDATKALTAIGQWGAALQATPVPASGQAVKGKLLTALSQLRAGVTEVASGEHSGSHSLISQGQASLQNAVIALSQAIAQVP